MIPNVWTFALLALAAFRATRLLGWDTFPPVARARALLLDEWVEPICPSCRAGREDCEMTAPASWTGLARCPNCSSDAAAIFREGYGRPLLGELFSCAFCLGWWVCLGLYLSWVVLPTATLVLSVPLALSTLVGLAAKNLDA